MRFTHKIVFSEQNQHVVDRVRQFLTTQGYIVRMTMEGLETEGRLGTFAGGELQQIRQSLRRLTHDEASWR